MLKNSCYHHSSGDLSEAEIAAVLAQHEKDLAATRAKLAGGRDRHMDELRQKLAQRRRQREETLRNKHSQEVSHIYLS